MPPKEQKNGDIQEVVGLFKSYWPDCEIRYENLLNPTADFVIDIYKRFIIEENSRLAELLGEDTVFYEFDDNTSLFCSVKQIFNELNMSAFCLNDLYRPAPKRTRLFMKKIAHYMIYVNNIFDISEDLLRSLDKEASEMKDLENEEQSLLNEIAETAALVASNNDICNKLSIEVSEKDAAHKKMLFDKKTKDNIFLKKQQEIDDLKMKSESEQHEFLHLEKEVSDLRDRLVTEQCFETLKNTAKALSEEKEALFKDILNLNDNLKEHKKIDHVFSSFADQLKNINFNALTDKVTTQSEAKELKELISENHNITSSIKSLQTEVEELNKLRSHISHEIETKESDYIIINEQMKTEITHLKKTYDEYECSILKKNKEIQQLEKNIEDSSEEISLIKRATSSYKNDFTCEYEKLLESHAHVIDESYKTLKAIKIRLDSLKKKS